MPYQSSNWTGRVPRTMNEAFGPDTRLTRTQDRRETGFAFIISAFLTFLVAIAIIFVPNYAHADMLPLVKPEPMVQKWDIANDHCRGDETDPQTNVYCAQRGQITQVLLGSGYVQSDTGTWIGPLTLNRFAEFMYTADGMAQANNRTFADAQANTVDYLKHNLNKDVALRVQFAIWNTPDVRVVVQQRFPYGFAAWAKMMREIAQDHADDNDPTLQLEPLP